MVAAAAASLLEAAPGRNQDGDLLPYPSAFGRTLIMCSAGPDNTFSLRRAPRRSCRYAGWNLVDAADPRVLQDLKSADQQLEAAHRAERVGRYGRVRRAARSASQNVR